MIRLSKLKRSNHFCLSICCCLVVWLNFGTRSLLAQYETATLTGVVADQQKARIAEALVTVSNNATSLERKTTTDAQGMFTFLSLPIGTYTLRIEHSGFSAFASHKVVLTVAQTLAVSAEMKVGELDQTVEAVDRGDLALETESSQRGQIFTTDDLKSLPLINREYSQLVLLTTGTSQSPIGIESGSIAREGSFNVDGLRSTFNNYLLDGVDNNAYGTSNQGFSNQVIQPSPDSIAQFQVVINNESAEYGRAPGATVNVAFASGTNDFHFNLYEFNRNPMFNAKGYFTTGNPSIRRNQYGGTFGGPILKKKAFLFMDFEGFNQAHSTPSYSVIPTAAELGGTFPTVVTNPYTGEKYEDKDGHPTQIPANDFSQAARKIAAYWPAPNTSNNGYNYVQSQEITDHVEKYNLRLDNQWSNSLTSYVRLSQSKEYSLDGVTLPQPLDGGTDGNIRVLDQQLALGVTKQIGATRLLDARLGVSYTKGAKSPVEVGEAGAEEGFGIPGLTTNSRIAGGLPSIYIEGYSQIGRLATNPQWQYPFVLNPKVSYSWLMGKHFLKAGYEYQRIQTQVEDEYPLYGLYVFYAGFSGNYLADFMFGAPYEYWLTNLRVAHIRQAMHFAYFQDDWKVSGHLTLNLGLRYEYGSPLWDKDNILSNFDPSTSPTTGQMIEAKSGGIYDRALVKPDLNDFAPRIGFAYGVAKNTVLHGGFGVSYAHYYRAGSGNILALNAPNTLFAQQTQVNPTASSFRTLDDGFPTDMTAASKFNPLTTDVSYIPKNFRDGYVESFFLSLQHQISSNSFLDIAYVGNHGLKMLEFANYNQKNPASDFARPISTWGDITYAFNGAYDHYNSLQVRYEWRPRQGITVLNSFTWSRTFDNAAGTLENFNGNASTPQNIYDMGADYGPSNYDQPAANITSVVYDLPIGSGRKLLSEAPAVTQAFIGGWQLAAINTMNSGQPITVTYTPSTANSVSNISSDFRGANTYRPNRVAGQSIRAHTLGDPTQYLNSSAFSAPATYDASGNLSSPFGDASRNLVRGPDYYNLNFSLNKTFSLPVDRMKLQFRAEAYNLLNKTNFSAPDSGLSDTSFGTISSTFSPRVLQLGLKLSY
jgi:hypothetical protein